MDWKTVATIAVTISLAVVGYINTLRLQRRKDRLDRINRQLKDLYGPLLAMTMASERAWSAFRQKYGASGGFWSDSSSKRPFEIECWPTWVTSVFMPINEQMVEVITRGADLIDEEKMPICLLDLCAHVAAYRPVLKQWEQGDYSEQTSVIDFPRDVHNYVDAAFRRIKAEQVKLLGTKVQAINDPVEGLSANTKEEHTV